MIILATVIVGDLLQANQSFIAHQVNCRGVMGAGVAKQLKAAYPGLYRQYQQDCKAKASALLGSITTFNTGEQVIINLFAQEGYGRGKRQTDYGACRSCLHAIKDLMHQQEGSTIAFPYLVGCGLAGGEWDIVGEMITSILPSGRVYFYQFA